MILADRVAAADVIHVVFLKLAKTGSGHAVEWQAYLRRAVRNECYSVMRARRRDIVIAIDGPLLESVEGVEDRPAERLALE
jgi:DNA-directed RNA polymerase specialized sigma24 family protein